MALLFAISFGVLKLVNAAPSTVSDASAPTGFANASMVPPAASSCSSSQEPRPFSSKHWGPDSGVSWTEMDLHSRLSFGKKMGEKDATFHSAPYGRGLYAADQREKPTYSRGRRGEVEKQRWQSGAYAESKSELMAREGALVRALQHAHLQLQQKQSNLPIEQTYLLQPDSEEHRHHQVDSERFEPSEHKKGVQASYEEYSKVRGYKTWGLRKNPQTKSEEKRKSSYRPRSHQYGGISISRTSKQFQQQNMPVETAAVETAVEQQLPHFLNLVADPESDFARVRRRSRLFSF
eukprot:gb/GEZN01011016.1/.p1 GENE.gb/GEZN01011016.1/~~gb/GEZN01011016.1/.p1  ORF type:complete len:292 (-),score=34.51 gb/GEZN01011016.1/:253-1128(-)